MTTDSAATARGRRFPSPPKLRIAALVFAALAVVLVAIVGLTGARRLQPDEIVREPGAYDSPGNRYRVVVAESDARTVTFTLVSPRPWKRVAAILDHGRPLPAVAEFEVERDWFLCFDEYDRLWLFIGQREPGTELRKTSSGGFVPRIQSVMMFGFFFLGTQPIDSVSVVSSTGDWKGAPPRFFAEIPGKEGAPIAVWGEIPPIPGAPPGFSPAEHAAARSHWR
jgi:hypothetical protein